MIANYNLSERQNKRFVNNRIYCDTSVFDNDFMMSCADRICIQCGNDHSFRGNFEDMAMSIDVLSNLLSKDKRNIKSEMCLT